MEYYSVMKKDSLESPVEKWVDLEIVELGKITQWEKFKKSQEISNMRATKCK